MTYDNDMAMSKPIPNSSSNHLSPEQIHKIARYVSLTDTIGEAPALHLDIDLGQAPYNLGPNSCKSALVTTIRALADFINEADESGPDFMSFIDEFQGPQFIDDESGVTDHPIGAWTFDFSTVPVEKMDRAWPEIIIDGKQYSADYIKE